MTDNITRADIEQTREQLLDGLQFAQHRLKEYQEQAAFGGDEQPMIDEMAKIARIESRLAGVGYAKVKVEQNERAAASAQRVAERQAAISEIRSTLDEHAAAMAELEKALAKQLSVGERISSLAKNIERQAVDLFPGIQSALHEMVLNSPVDKFLRAAGVFDVPNVAKTLQSLCDLAQRVANDREKALQYVASLEQAEG